MSPSAAGERVDARHVVLVGLMGVGKTTVGERLAARLERPFVDTDELVEAAAGRSVAEIFATSGEPAFRDLERQAVADACASPSPLVIACGGGAVLDADNRRALTRAGIVVWLRADASELAARVGAGDERPLLAGRPVVETLERLQQVRAASYEAVADVTVDTDALDPEAVTDRVLEAVTACAA